MWFGRPFYRPCQGVVSITGPSSKAISTDHRPSTEYASRTFPASLQRCQNPTDVDYSVDDDGSPSIDGAALRRDAVDCLIVALRVHVHTSARLRPNRLEAVRRVPREYQPRDGGYGGRLRGTASWDIAAAGMRGPPHLFSRI